MRGNHGGYFIGCFRGTKKISILTLRNENRGCHQYKRATSRNLKEKSPRKLGVQAED